MRTKKAWWLVCGLVLLGCDPQTPTPPDTDPSEANMPDEVPLVCPSSELVQTASGCVPRSTSNGAWATTTDPGVEEYFASPTAACDRQRQVLAPTAAAEEPTEFPPGQAVWYLAQCNWSGDGSPPSVVFFECFDGPYFVDPAAPGHCRHDLADVQPTEGGN